jgi:hypothetical protein
MLLSDYLFFFESAVLSWQSAVFIEKYCLLPTAYFLLSTAYCPLPTAYCPLLTAYCLLLTAYCLPTTPKPVFLYSKMLSSRFRLRFLFRKAIRSLRLLAQRHRQSACCILRV